MWSYSQLNERRFEKSHREGVLNSSTEAQEVVPTQDQEYLS